MQEFTSWVFCESEPTIICSLLAEGSLWFDLKSPLHIRSEGEVQLYLPSTHMVEGGTRVSFDQTVAGPRLRHPGAVLNMTHLRLLSDRLPHPGVVLNRTCHHSISDRLPQTCKDDEHDPLCTRRHHGETE